MQKTYSRGIITFTLLMVSLIANSESYALPFAITPTVGTSLPTGVISGQTATALYTVTNNTGSVRAGNFVKYLPPNVNQVATDPSQTDLCGSTFTLNPKGASGSSCTLELLISGSVNANDPDPHHHLFVCFPGGITCAGTPNPLNITATTPTAFTQAYVGNFGTNTVSLCSINTNTGTLNVCQDSGAGAIFDFPAGISLNQMGTLAYVANFGGSVGTTVSQCSINASSGQLSECVNADGDGSAIFAGPLGVTLDLLGTHAYVGNLGDNTVSVCTVNASSGKLEACFVTGGPFMGPVMAFDASGTRAYVSNTADGSISLCNINTSTGALSGCANADGDGSAVFNGPAFMSITASGTRLYVSDNGGGGGTSVSFCSINLITGKLFACQDSGVGPVFNGPVGVVLNAATTQMYVPNNAGTTVSLCSINASTGQLISCSNSDGDGSAVFSSPSGVALK
jgi:DNA-binding beta-propeller fold protein YncE